MQQFGAFVGQINGLSGEPTIDQSSSARRQTDQPEWGAPEQCGTLGRAPSIGIKLVSHLLHRHEPTLEGDLMDPKTTNDTTSEEATSQDTGTLVEEELLVEEISIDGMCGVY